MYVCCMELVEEGTKAGNLPVDAELPPGRPIVPGIAVLDDAGVNEDRN